MLNIGDKVVCHIFRNSQPYEVKGTITKMNNVYLVIDNDYIVPRTTATKVED